MMANKVGVIREIPRYGNSFLYFDVEKLYFDVEKLYPELFDTNFIVNGFSKWIIQGEWNDDVIAKEILLFLEKEKALTPLEILRTHNLLDVNDEVVNEGFKDLLVEAYAGNLSLDEYVLFLHNCCYSRMYNLDLPTIDWKEVREGIRKKIKYLVKSDEIDSHFHKIIGDESKEYFTEDEWLTYQIIKEFRDKVSDLCGMPKGADGLELRLSNSYFVALDNLSSISRNVSDTIARAVTGGSVTKRALYHNTKEIVLPLKYREHGMRKGRKQLL